MTMETTEAVPASSSEGGSDPEALGGSPISTRGMGDPASASTRKGKSCKGYLYYSSRLKSQSGKPVCVGVSRTLQQVPGYIVGESELEASKEGRNLSDFKYSCVGYSVFMDSNNGESDKGEHKAELPFCVGIELLVDRRVSAPDHTPVHASNRDDSIHQQQPQKSPHSIGEEFLSRFSRNAGLVASGVSRNLQRAAHYVKDNLDDILYPDRRRPK
ncbi:altered inheritance of mitochondria protein [Wolffia australiana]